MTSPFFFALRRTARRLALALAMGAGATSGFAGEGHDHGDPAPAAAAAASPRLAAHSDLFELVGIVENGAMTVYLDRYASNEPVAGARIDYESGAHKGTAQPQADGTYAIRFDALGQPGDLPFAFTVTAGAETDLLAGDLHIHDPHEQAGDAPRAPLPWPAYAALAAAVAIALFLARKIRGGLRRQPG